MVYTLDTNIIIRYLRNDPIVRQNFNDSVLRGDDLVVPKVVNYEIRRGFRVTSAPRKEAVYKILTERCYLAEMDVYSWERAEYVYAGLYSKGFTICEMDILVAAFCLENDYTLVTNNVKHFEQIDGLRFVNWAV